MRVFSTAFFKPKDLFGPTSESPTVKMAVRAGERVTVPATPRVGKVGAVASALLLLAGVDAATYVMSTPSPGLTHSSGYVGPPVLSARPASVTADDLKAELRRRLGTPSAVNEYLVAARAGLRQRVGTSDSSPRKAAEAIRVWLED